jgi:hypothetical protein
MAQAASLRATAIDLTTARSDGRLVDVSNVVRLRKRIVRGAGAAKLLAVSVAIPVAIAVVSGFFRLVLLVGLAWVGVRLFGGLRLGDARVAWAVLALVAFDCLVSVLAAAAAADPPGIDLGAARHGQFDGVGESVLSYADAYVPLTAAVLVWLLLGTPRVQALHSSRVVRLLALSGFGVVTAGVGVASLRAIRESEIDPWIVGFALEVGLDVVAGWGAAAVLLERRAGRHVPLVPPWELSTAVRQRRLFTGRQPVLVVALLSIVVVLASLGVLTALAAGAPPGTEEERAAHITAAVLSPILLVLAVVVHWIARRRAVLSAVEPRDRDARPPVLYLRSFRDDRLRVMTRSSPRRTWLEKAWGRRLERFEEVLVWHLWRYGPVLAVGRPHERARPLGAAREYLDDEEWQDEVKERMLDTGLLVIVLGRTKGLVWEMEKAAELGLGRRLLVVLPPVPESEIGERLELFATVGQSTGWRAPDPNASRNGLLALLRPDGEWLVITGRLRDEWHYEAALQTVVDVAVTE